MKHPSNIPEAIVGKVFARRGRLHAFESVDARRTALIVIDLDEASVGRDENCKNMVPNVNDVAGAVRSRGGVVAWVLSKITDATPTLEAIFGAGLARTYFGEGQGDGPGSKLCNKLDVARDDLFAIKSGASAFFPGKCDLHEQLKRLRIDTLLVSGTVTNVCCESSARDAVELGYKVVMVSDALAGHTHGLHEATLATFYRTFGDVRPSKDIMKLLDARQ